jgi:hypothetical protein
MLWTESCVFVGFGSGTSTRQSRCVPNGEICMSRINAILAAGAALAVIGAGGVAIAQNTNAPATYGNYELNAGFLPDPVYADVVAGGSRNAANLGGACRGGIANAPDVRVFYSAGSYPITIWAESSADTTIVINAPDGSYYCNDDMDGSRNPGIRFTNPAPGRYEIWVGAYNDSAQGAQARVFFSER